MHMLRNDDDYQHVHGDGTAELSHALCLEPISEEQVQKDFDSADPKTVGWNIAAIKHRHQSCHQPPPEHEDGPERSKPKQLSLTLLRSCRQIYWEANKVHYANNTFAFSCTDVLERFVTARFKNKQHFAIRNLYLDISVLHITNIDTWCESISKVVLRRLKSVRYLYLNLVQTYCSCCVEICGYKDSQMTELQGKMLGKLSKLPLKGATLLLDDSGFLNMLGSDAWTTDYDELEQQHRWTMKQKQDFSKKVRNVVLG